MKTKSMKTKYESMKTKKVKQIQTIIVSEIYSFILRTDIGASSGIYLYINIVTYHQLICFSITVDTH